MLVKVSSNGNDKALELQAAMEILAEVFGTRPGEVEEMILRRLEERSGQKARRRALVSYSRQFILSHPSDKVFK
ncbi:MAG: hypothetical protein PHY05_03240 [Methanothrix sp.]|nr:hypothetical protein [Methanothrix sp.]